MTDVRLEVSGIPFDGWKSISYGRSMENLAGSFSFVAVASESGDIKCGNACKITVNGIEVITGFIEVVRPSISSSSHEVVFSGRDETADVIDSTLSAKSVEITSGVTLVDVIKKTLTAIEAPIDVVDTASFLLPFTEEDIISSEAGQTAFSFIEKYARKRQVLLTSDGSGRILIARAAQQLATFNLINREDGEGNNVITSSADYDYTGRFGMYTVVGQKNLSGQNSSPDPDLEDAVSVESTNVFDDEIRRTRRMVIVADGSYSPQEATDRAKWEADIRKARSLTYTATIDGIVDKFGLPYQVNRLVQVDDESAGISSTMLLKSIDCKITDSGSETVMKLMIPNAFTLELTQPDLNKKKANQVGIDYT